MIKRGHAGGQRDRDQVRLDEMDVGVDAARGGDEPLAVDRRGGRADEQIGVVDDVGVAGAAHAGDQAVLHADVGLEDAEHRVDDDDVGDQEVELAGAGSRSFIIRPVRMVLPQPRSTSSP